MRIAIISGKGGTGKSSITSSLAYSLGKRKRIVLVDADSDCPNQHILFKGRVRMKKPISVSKIALVDLEKCTGCGKCAKACMFDAIRLAGAAAAVDGVGCEGCGACVVACPEKAIKLIPVKSGSLIVSETRDFPLVYGRLLPGRSGTGRMVFNARKLADEVAKRRKAGLIIIDAPPGIGCPVIAAIAGCNHVIGVAEPTPAGMVNLERALQVAEHFRIPYSIVMNKEGLSKKYERKIAGKFGKKLIARIPYDEEIPRLLAAGTLPILGKGRGAKALRKLAEGVIGMIA